MKNRDHLFTIGRHRPVYFWAGPTTVAMNRLKFMGAPVNERVHLDAHSPEAARSLAQAGFNWAYMMVNWGFPPEEEEAQRQSFRQAITSFHQAGIQVFGYVQLSNCVYAGCYRKKPWYAHDPHGRLIHYYTGRYMTCPLSPEWRVQLRRQVETIVEAGADGVFLDNPWMGMHILSLFDTWITGAGCYCARCRETYAAVSEGHPIPDPLDPQDPDTRHYLTWRAWVNWQLIGELVDLARSSRAGVVVAENVFDAINTNTYAEFGVDLPHAARISDLVMIEDFSLPRLASDGTPVSNAITCKAAQAWSGDTPVTTDPYIAGIGFDPVYTPRQFRQAVAEGAACGTATVIKGTEFFDPRDGGFTLLTGRPFSRERAALGQIHRWLEAHASLYENRQPASPVAVYFPYQDLPFDWRYAAPLTFAACQTLLAAGLPYRIVGPGDWDGVQVLILPPAGEGHLDRRLEAFAAGGGRVIALGELRPPADDRGRPEATLVWASERPGLTFLQRHPRLRALTRRIVTSIYRAYFDRRPFRTLLDRTQMTQRVLLGGAEYSPLFRLPPESVRLELLKALDDPVTPSVRSSLPVLVGWWRQGQIDQVHLFNYADTGQEVTVTLPWPVQGQVLSPDNDETLPFEGRSLSLYLDVYTILRCQRKGT